MTVLMQQMTRLRRAVVISALIAVPLAPLTGCAGGDDTGGGGGGGDTQQDDGGGKDDEGIY